MGLLGDKMAEELQKFAECEHKQWKCESCNCRCTHDTIIMPYLQEIDRLRALVQNVNRLFDDDTIQPRDLERIGNELKQAAESEGGG